MFIFTAKLQRKRLILGLLGGIVLCAVVTTAIAPLFSSSIASSPSVPSPKKIKTAEDRIAYLEAYGWLVNPEPLAVEELLVPAEFDATYNDYLTLQSSQGFDLSKYQGQKVKRYAYEILNYPTGETGVQVAILLYKNTVIGGEVLSSRPNGFIHGLSMPETEITPQSPTA